jgi:hypothetical protein
LPEVKVESVMAKTINAIALISDLFQNSILEGEYVDFYMESAVTLILLWDRGGMYAIFRAQYPGYGATYFRSRYLTVPETEMLFPLTERFVGTVKELQQM